MAACVPYHDSRSILRPSRSLHLCLQQRRHCRESNNGRVGELKTTSKQLTYHPYFMFLSTSCIRRHPLFRLPLLLLLQRTFHHTARNMGKPRLVIICRHAQSEVLYLLASASFRIDENERVTKIEKSINPHPITGSRSPLKDGSKLTKQAGSSAHYSGQQTQSTFS